MIICTQCGENNSDESRFCQKCGKKLQSSRQASASSAPLIRDLEPFRHTGMPDLSWKSLLRMLEAWGYVAVLLGVAGACAYYRVWWPLYPAVGLLGLIVWARKI